MLNQLAAKNIDLSDGLGIPATIDPQTGDLFGVGLVHESPTARRGRDLLPYLFGPLSDPPSVVYTMTRDVRISDDEWSIHQANLRFDITVIHPGLLGDEYSKTIGHYHPIKPGTELSYPELYYCLSGRGLVLLQHQQSTQVIDDALLVSLLAGQYCIIPPGYGHVTINAGPDELVLANWVAREMVSDYHQFTEHHGGAYHLLRGTRGPAAVSDPFYTLVAPVRSVVPVEANEVGLCFFEPIYTQAVSKLHRLRWLTHPEEATLLWQQVLFDDAEPIQYGQVQAIN